MYPYKRLQQIGPKCLCWGSFIENPNPLEIKAGLPTHDIPTAHVVYWEVDPTFGTIRMHCAGELFPSQHWIVPGL